MDAEPSAMPSAPFIPRPVLFDGVSAHGRWRIKNYIIHLPDTEFHSAQFEGGLAVAQALLPQPAQAPGRAGAGFIIRHQGAGRNYIVLCYWDHGNELITHVLVHDQQTDGRLGSNWHDGRGKYSFCVWDLEVIWQERNAYVDTVMRAEPEIGTYLARPAV